MFRTDLFKGKRFLVTGGGTGLEILMPGLAQCRHMQERVAVIGVEG